MRAGPSFGTRAAAGIAILVVIAVIYGVLVAAGAAPVPSSVASLAASSGIGHGQRLVAGYYISQPFTSLGSGLPPYVLAADTASGSPSIHVKPTLADVKAGKLAVIVDTATGDGSRWSPDAAHTVGAWGTVVATTAVVVILIIIAAFWLGAVLADLLARRLPATASPRRS